MVLGGRLTIGAGEKRRFQTLEGLRGIAALVIFASHSPNETIDTLLPVRYLGVDFFFVLSGFVLAHAYGVKLSDRSMSALEFMVRRYIRLWPLYLFGTAAGVLVALRDDWSVPKILVSAVCAVLFLPVFSRRVSPDPHAVFPLNSPAWSLFFELVANLVYALVAPFLKRWLLIAILVLGAALLVALSFKHGELNGGVLISNFEMGFARVIWSFFAGVSVHRLWLWRPAIRLSPIPCVVALVAMLAVPLELLWVFLGFPLLVYVAASAEPAKWQTPLFINLGVVSYGLYAIHLPVIYLVHGFIPIDSVWVTLALGIVLSLIVIGLDRWLDRPARALLERRLAAGPWRLDSVRQR